MSSLGDALRLIALLGPEHGRLPAMLKAIGIEGWQWEENADNKNQSANTLAELSTAGDGQAPLEAWPRVAGAPGSGIKPKRYRSEAWHFPLVVVEQYQAQSSTDKPSPLQALAEQPPLSLQQADKPGTNPKPETPQPANLWPLGLLKNNLHKHLNQAFVSPYLDLAALACELAQGKALARLPYKNGQRFPSEAWLYLDVSDNHLLYQADYLQLYQSLNRQLGCNAISQTLELLRTDPDQACYRISQRFARPQLNAVRRGALPLPPVGASCLLVVDIQRLHKPVWRRLLLALTEQQSQALIMPLQINQSLGLSTNALSLANIGQSSCKSVKTDTAQPRIPGAEDSRQQKTFDLTAQKLSAAELKAAELKAAEQKSTQQKQRLLAALGLTPHYFNLALVRALRLALTDAGPELEQEILSDERRIEWNYSLKRGNWRRATQASQLDTAALLAAIDPESQQSYATKALALIKQHIPEHLESVLREHQLVALASVKSALTHASQIEAELADYYTRLAARLWQNAEANSLNKAHAQNSYNQSSYNQSSYKEDRHIQELGFVLNQAQRLSPFMEQLGKPLLEPLSQCFTLAQHQWLGYSGNAVDVPIMHEALARELKHQADDPYQPAQLRFDGRDLWLAPLRAQAPDNNPVSSANSVTSSIISSSASATSVTSAPADQGHHSGEHTPGISLADLRDSQWLSPSIQQQPTRRFAPPAPGASLKLSSQAESLQLRGFSSMDFYWAESLSLGPEGLVVEAQGIRLHLPNGPQASGFDKAMAKSLNQGVDQGSDESNGESNGERITEPNPAASNPPVISLTERAPAWLAQYPPHWDAQGLYIDLPVKQLSLRLRYIPPGSFLMGSPEHELGRGENETQHPVSLTQGFWLGETTVSQALWQAVMGHNPSKFAKTTDEELARYPVDSVSYQDCEAFFNRINQRLRDKPAGHSLPPLGFPTETQWELACRAGSTGPFSTGDNLSPEQANYQGTSPKALTAFNPNVWGLYQMHGNLWEWCRDDLREYSGEPVVDPMGELVSDRAALRGGGWFDYVQFCRSANRSSYRHSDHRSYDIGLRVAMAATA